MKVQKYYCKRLRSNLSEEVFVINKVKNKSKMPS